MTGAGPATITCPVQSTTCDLADAYQPLAASFTGDCGNNGTLQGLITGPFTGCADGVIIVTYSGSDECGNPISAECEVDVEGAGAATLVCPAATITCAEANGFAVPSATFFGPCGNNGSVAGQISTPYSGCADGIIEILYSGIDNCGNPLSELCTINVTGAGPATVQCPVVTISCEEAPTFTPGPATFAGSCNNTGTLAGQIQTPFAGCSAGSLTVLYSGTDNCGNPLSQLCTVNVTGGAAPVVACPVVTLSCEETNTFVPLPASYTGPCNNNGTLTGVVTVPYDGCGAGTITVLYSGVDNCGAQLSQTCTVTVNGPGPIDLVCPVNTVTCEEAPTFVPAPESFTGPCGINGVLTGSIQTPYSGCGAGTIGVLYSGTDNCGNAASLSCTVNVTGGASPIVACPVVNIGCDEALTFTPGPASFTGGCNNNGSLSGTIQVPYSCLLYTSPSPRDRG